MQNDVSNEANANERNKTSKTKKNGEKTRKKRGYVKNAREKREKKLETRLKQKPSIHQPTGTANKNVNLFPIEIKTCSYEKRPKTCLQ